LYLYNILGLLLYKFCPKHMKYLQSKGEWSQQFVINNLWDNKCLCMKRSMVSYIQKTALFLKYLERKYKNR
jgi:hypothetical protein